MKKIDSILAMAGIVVSVGAAVNVSAATYKGYDVHIPKLGSMTTGTIKKTTTGSAYNKVGTIGGSSTVVMAIRTTSNNANVTSTRQTSKDDSTVTLDYKAASTVKGKNTTLALSTPLLELSSVHNTGSWTPN
ncbi:hypothetical protein [Lapidilactobacillus bayanensis]|uniref:hypothetical protein n=1 Tax=Lapidilactobacillus bayanensis TaxID=2485998 RepID=UPI000F791F4D|nr:hypothetical protein [Lapidilactobacillus bayanensis]